MPEFDQCIAVDLPFFLKLLNDHAINLVWVNQYYCREKNSNIEPFTQHWLRHSHTPLFALLFARFFLRCSSIAAIVIVANHLPLPLLLLLLS
jgi:hypothetical protein